MRAPLQLPKNARTEVVNAYPVPNENHLDLQAGLSLAQGIAIARSYWKQALIIWLAFTVLAAIAIKFLPKTYTATTTLIVDTNQKDPLAGQEFPVNLLNNYVATQAELITSPVVLLLVVDRMDLTHDKEFASGFRGLQSDIREYVEKSLSSAIQIDEGRGGQLLYLSASSRDPDKAAKIANLVAEMYLTQERRRINDPAGERAQRYSAQLADLRAKVAAAQEKVATFRQQKGITDVSEGPDPENPDTETQALTSLEEHLLEAQNLRRSLEAKLAGHQPATAEAVASQQVQQLQTQLRSLQSQLAQMSGTYGAQHPKVLEVKAQIAVARHSLNEEMSKLTENNVTELDRAKALEEKYALAVNDQRTKVLRLREIQGDGEKLLLELHSAESVYKRALDGYDQIMFASVGDYTNVTIVSSATAPVNYSKPNKLKLLLLAVIAGLGIGLGSTVAYELFFDRRLRCRDDIERSFGIPVLMEFAAIPLALKHS
jgi:succinoglycan biosynthesis transport protein ExoP